MVQAKTVLYYEGNWIILPFPQKPTVLARSWLIDQGEVSKEVLEKILERTQEHEGHLHWLGSWGKKGRNSLRAPVFCAKGNRTYCPARFLLAKFLDISYESLPFPITSNCEIGKGCIKPEHQQPYIPKPRLTTVDLVLEELTNKQRQVKQPPQERERDIFDFLTNEVLPDSENDDDT